MAKISLLLIIGILLVASVIAYSFSNLPPNFYIRADRNPYNMTSLSVDDKEALECHYGSYDINITKIWEYGGCLFYDADVGSLQFRKKSASCNLDRDKYIKGLVCEPTLVDDAEAEHCVQNEVITLTKTDIIMEDITKRLQAHASSIRSSEHCNRIGGIGL